MGEPMIFHLEKYDRLILVCCPNGCHATPIPTKMMKEARKYTHARVKEVPGGMMIEFIKEPDDRPAV